MNLKSFFQQLAMTTTTKGIELLLTSDNSPFVKRPSPSPKGVKRIPKDKENKKSTGS